MTLSFDPFNQMNQIKYKFIERRKSEALTLKVDLVVDLVSRG